MYGWVSGETFRDVMFIEYGFYNPEVEELFIQFIQSNNRIDLDLINNEITRIEAEMKSIVTIPDHEVIKKRLISLNSLPITNAEQSDGIAQLQSVADQAEPTTWIEKSTEHAFRHITVTIGLKEGTQADKAIFLRLTPLITDAINAQLFKQGFYQNEVSWPIHNTVHDTMLFHAIYTVRKKAQNTRVIAKELATLLAQLDVTSCQKEVAHYIQGFMHTANWHTFPIDYYRYSGMLVSRNEIAKLFTPVNIQLVLKKLIVDVSPTTTSHWENLK